MGEYRGNLEVTRKLKAGFWRDGEYIPPHRTKNEKARQRQQWDDEVIAAKTPTGVKVSRQSNGIKVTLPGDIEVTAHDNGKTSIFIGDSIYGLVESTPEAVAEFIEKNT